MWNYTISTHAKPSGLTIRSRITLTLTNSLDEYYKHLNEMRAKLEQMLPGSFKAKYSVGISGLMVQTYAKTSGDAHRIAYQMENYIKSAIIALKT